MSGFGAQPGIQGGGPVGGQGIGAASGGLGGLLQQLLPQLAPLLQQFQQQQQLQQPPQAPQALPQPPQPPQALPQTPFNPTTAPAIQRPQAIAPQSAQGVHASQLVRPSGPGQGFSLPQAPQQQGGIFDPTGQSLQQVIDSFNPHQQQSGGFRLRAHQTVPQAAAPTGFGAIVPQAFQNQALVRPFEGRFL